MDMVDFGTREMATLDVTIAVKLRSRYFFEMNITISQELERLVAMEGVLANDIDEWKRLAERRRCGREIASEPAPS